MNCPKCKEGELLYARRGQIEELYKTDENGQMMKELVEVKKEFFLNPHYYCTECDYAYDIVEKEEISDVDYDDLDNDDDEDYDYNDDEEEEI